MTEALNNQNAIYDDFVLVHNGLSAWLAAVVRFSYSDNILIYSRTASHVSFTYSSSKITPSMQQIASSENPKCNEGPRTSTIPVLISNRITKGYSSKTVNFSTLHYVTYQSIPVTPITCAAKLVLLNIRSLTNKSLLVNDLISTCHCNLHSANTLIESAPPNNFY